MPWAWETNSFLFDFNNLLAIAPDFTRDVGVVRHTLMQAKPGGPTPLFDAIFLQWSG